MNKTQTDWLAANNITYTNAHGFDQFMHPAFLVEVVDGEVVVYDMTAGYDDDYVPSREVASLREGLALGLSYAR